jgi:hypothetical protein
MIPLRCFAHREGPRLVMWDKARGRPLVVLAAICLGGCAFVRPPQAIPPPTLGVAHADRLLRAERIEVEIDWLPGCRPAAATVDGIQSFLREYAAPAQGVEVWLDEEIASGRDGDEWRTMETHRRPERGGAVESIYLLFVPRLAPGELRPRRGRVSGTDSP